MGDEQLALESVTNTEASVNATHHDKTPFAKMFHYTLTVGEPRQTQPLAKK